MLAMRIIISRFVRCKRSDLMDYRKLAIDELRAVQQLRAAERICRDRLDELSAELHAFKIPSPQADPVQGGGNKTEERWLSIIASQMDEERRLKNVRRRLRRFNTAWRTLSERDKAALIEWYITPGNFDRAEKVSGEQRCSRRTAFDYRDDAIINFARAFYGEVVT